MNEKIIVANWKMSPSTLEEAQDLFRASAGAIVCPPFVYLEELSKIKSEAVLGAQDIALSSESSQTGEVSGEMLVQFSVKYVIIGHSDRRFKLGESDETVNKKLRLALMSGLIPIVCIGEKTREGDFESFLKNQVMATFDGLSSDQIKKCLIAYEPVWAISATPGAKSDTPESALESIRIISHILVSDLGFRISDLTYLYGGSVTSANARDFLAMDEIAGVLVGKASTDKNEIRKIIEISLINSGNA